MYRNLSLIMHLSMLSGGVLILIRHSCPRDWLLTLWTRPRVRIFDFSLSGGRAVLTVACIPGRLGTSCFISSWMAAIADVQEEEVCNLILSWS